MVVSVTRQLFCIAPSHSIRTVNFTDERGVPLILHAGSVLSYRDVAPLGQGRLVIHRKCLVTALARDAAQARNIELIKQE